ncbi:MAG: glycosyltransferase, partial [Bacteroidota bacterium]|nr:glycosyltransferase [Bacteroidota bacterium]
LELLHDNGDAEIPKGEFFKAKYGILINNKDVEGLSKALHYLKENPSELERYSKLSLERAKAYELKSIYAKFNQFITS